MTIMHKGRQIAKVLETNTRVVVMFSYQTRFFETWSAAIRFLMCNGYSF